MKTRRQDQRSGSHASTAARGRSAQPRRHFLQSLVVGGAALVGLETAAGVRQSTPATLPHSELLFKYFPSNSVWSQFVQRLAKHSTQGGVEFNEMHRALRRMRVGDPLSWRDEWLELADYIERVARRQLAEGHRATARNAFRRASAYLFSAQIFLSEVESGDEKRRILGKQRAVFAEAARLYEPAFEWVEVPFGGSSLAGYFFSGGAPGAPVLIRLFPNVDWLFSEVLWSAEHGQANLVCYDLGSGPLRERGLFNKPDYEVPVRALIDYLLSRKDVDPKKLVLYGHNGQLSLYSLRAAAFDQRVAAVACVGASYDLSEDYEGKPTAELQPSFGVQSEEEVRRELRRYSLKGLLGKVKCPVLIAYGANDPGANEKAIEKVYSELGGAKELKRWTPEEHVITRWGTDNPMETVSFMLDWVNDRLDTHPKQTRSKG